MIRVRYTEGHELNIEGHAGYAICGQDIVCAGVSAIVYALLGWLVDNQDEVEDLVGPLVEDGRLYVSCSGSDKVSTAFEVAMSGIEQIAGQYPNHVVIEYDRTSR